MKKIAAMALATLAMGSMEAQAADYGIGVSVQSNDSTIYAPVELNDKFRIEPSVRYRKTEFNDGDSELETLELGVGLFGLSAVNKSVRLYYGARASYVDQESTQVFLVGGLLAPTMIRTSQDSDGYRLSPTIGFEFLFNERLSLGGEAEYFFQDIKGDGVDTETSGTDTRLILRFKF